MRRGDRVRAWLCGLVAALTVGGCHRAEDGGERPAPSRTREVVVYSSADKEFAELIFKAYEATSGVKVLPVYDTEETKTAGLTARLLAEAAHPRADVFWSSDTSRALALVERGIAAPYASPSAATIPARYKDAGGRWTGFGARIRVLLYNTEKVKPADLPTSLRDFTKPEWKGRFAFANPHFGTMSFHSAALFVALGDAKATELFRALKDNGAIVAAGNADVKDRVSDGRVAAGLVDEDDAVVAVREKKPVAIAILDQAEGGLGTPVMPNTAMLVAGAPQLEEAKRFLDFLLSPESEAILAKSDAAQYPLHPGAAGPSGLPPLEKIRPMDVGYDAIARKLPEMDRAMKALFGL
jgi:iron(III) transport system substrate-binding protein